MLTSSSQGQVKWSRILQLSEEKSLYIHTHIAVETNAEGKHPRCMVRATFYYQKGTMQGDERALFNLCLGLQICKDSVVVKVVLEHADSRIVYLDKRGLWPVIQQC